MEQFQIGEQTFSNEELYRIGKLHFPKRYWIKRAIGIFLWIFAFDYSISIPFTTIFWALRLEEPMRTYAFLAIYIPLGVLLIAGLVVFILSFVPEKKEVYIEYAKKYLIKANANLQARDKKLERRRLKELAYYKKLLDKGVISQEDYDKKKEELTK